MRFVPHHRLPAEERARAVACDGACEAGLQLSHWPGHRTPAEYRADLGVEAALRFAREPLLTKRGPGLAYATNDHHDADGVLSLFAVLQPNLALPRGASLARAAAFSDFRHGTDEAALKLAAVLDGLRTSPASPLAGALEGLAPHDADAHATEQALAMLPSLLDDGAGLEAHRALWEEELGWFQTSGAALEAGEMQVTEVAPAGLTVVEWDAEAHPAVVDRVMAGDLVLHCIQAEQGVHYRADWRYHSWAETVSEERPRVRRVDLEKLCLPLNSLETNRRGRWLSAGYPGRGRTEALRFTNPAGEEMESHLQPTEVVQRLAWFLMERGGKA